MIKNKLPTFMTTIPSTGEKIKYVPYTDGQEKLLLIALESGETVDIIEATKKVISECYENINVDKLTTFDIDFLFLQLRIQSVSDKSELYYRSLVCGETGEECPTQVKLTIDLSKITVQQYDEEAESYKDYKPKDVKYGGIQFNMTESTGVIVKYPGFVEQEQFAKLKVVDEEGTVIYEPTKDDLIKLCVIAVYDDEQTLVRNTDFTEEELVEYYSSLTPKQRDILYEFIDNIPSVRYETKFVCKKCGFTEDIRFESLEDFFV
jgi:hypothetical protein